MRKSDIRDRVVETGIFLAAYAISSVVVFWVLGLGKLHQHGGFIVTYSVVFGILETLKILLAHEVEHQAQYQNSDARQIFGRLIQEAQMDWSVIDPYETPGCLEYEAQQVEAKAEEAYLQGWRPSSAIRTAK